MSIWFISRHQGAIEWIKQQGIKIDHFESHIDINQIKTGDTVIGTLPIHLAEQVCAKGAKFYFLSVNVRPEQRGTELSKEDLIAQACTSRKTPPCMKGIKTYGLFTIHHLISRSKDPALYERD